MMMESAVRLAQKPKANSAAAADSLSAFAEQGGTMSGVPPNCVELKLIGTSEINYPRCLRGGSRPSCLRSLCCNSLEQQVEVSTRKLFGTPEKHGLDQGPEMVRARVEKEKNGTLVHYTPITFLHPPPAPSSAFLFRTGASTAASLEISTVESPRRRLYASGRRRGLKIRVTSSHCTPWGRCCSRKALC